MPTVYEAPAERLTKKMTREQMDLLRLIVATNGGGVSMRGYSPSIVRGLVDRHMIQGKSGRPWMAVHTPLGLSWVRKNSEGAGA